MDILKTFEVFLSAPMSIIRQRKIKIMHVETNIFVPKLPISIDLNGVVRVLNNKTRKFETAGTLSVVSQDGVAVLSPNVRQGYNEYSNVSLQTEFMQAMMYPRTFEANRQLYQIQNSNLQRVISSLGS